MTKKYLFLITINIVILPFIVEAQNNWDIVGRWPDGSCNTVIADSIYVYIGSGGTIRIVDMDDPLSYVQSLLRIWFKW